MKILDKIVFLVFLGFSIFHLLVILNLIPQNIVWGGKFDEPSTIILLELFALLVMLFLAFLILSKNKLIDWQWKPKATNRWLLGFSLFFLLNTVGNLLAETYVEKAQAALTLFLSLALFSISKRK